MHKNDNNNNSDSSAEVDEAPYQPLVRAACKVVGLVWLVGWFGSAIHMLELRMNARKHQDWYLENGAFPHSGITAIVFSIL